MTRFAALCLAASMATCLVTGYLAFAHAGSALMGVFDIAFLIAVATCVAALLSVLGRIGLVAFLRDSRGVWWTTRREREDHRNDEDESGYDDGNYNDGPGSPRLG